MSVSPVSSPSQKRPLRPRGIPSPYTPEQKELAKSLYLQGLKAPVIAETISVPVGTIRKWSTRGGWPSLSAQTSVIRIQRAEGRAGSEAAANIQDRSNRVRSLLAAEVEAQAQALASQPPKPSELGNTPQRQGRAAIAKAIADTASTVFDWQSQVTQGLIVIGEVERADPRETPAAIDIQAESRLAGPEAGK